MVERAHDQTKQAQASDLLRHSTLTYRQIAARVGCSLATVRHAARVLGITPCIRKIAP
jgi:DNA-directed RNA polymerase specialized sigma24 family protein